MFRRKTLILATAMVLGGCRGVDYVHSVNRPFIANLPPDRIQCPARSVLLGVGYLCYPGEKDCAERQPCKTTEGLCWECSDDPCWQKKWTPCRDENKGDL